MPFSLALAGCVVCAGRARADQPPPAATTEAAAGKLAASSSAAASEADAVPDFDRLRASDSAAFALLGVAPVEIQLPSTPTEVSLGLGWRVSSTSRLFPQSLAVDVAPYWLFARSELTGDDMSDGSLAQVAGRNLTVSVGTTTRIDQVDGDTGEPTERSTTDVAVGVRTRWLDGRARVACWDDIEAAAQAITEKQGTALAGETAAIAARYPVQPIPDGASEAERGAIAKQNDAAAKALEKEIDLVRAREIEIAARRRAELADVATRCVAASAARTGLVADAALAASFRFPDERLAAGEWLAAGGWIVLAAQGKHNHVAGMARLLARHAPEGNDADMVADAGARYVHTRGRHALSTEVVYRFLTEDVPDRHLVRVDVAADVRISGDGWLVATFGRDYAARGTGTIFALLAFKWGFGEPRAAPPD